MKKYTTQGMNCGGRVKGYADGGRITGAAMTDGERSATRMSDGYRYEKDPIELTRPLSDPGAPGVDRILARQKASDDKSRRGGKD